MARAVNSTRIVVVFVLLVAVVSFLVVTSLPPASGAASTGTVCANVNEADTGQPISRATVKLWYIGGEQIASASTDVTGRACISPVGVTGAVSVVATYPTPRYDASSVDVVIVDGETLTVDFALQTRALAAITGTVTDEADGSPIEGITVYATDWFDMWTATTVADGTYLMTDITPTQSLIVWFIDPTSAYGTEFHDNKIDRDRAYRRGVPGGRVLDYVDVALGPAGTISGRVTDDRTGDPLAGATVFAHGNPNGGGLTSATTDATGAYILEGLAAGDYWIEFIAADHYTEWWDDSDPLQGTSISVTANNAIVGIDAGLWAGFIDVPQGQYYTAAVDWMVDQGITNGTTPHTFSPDAVVTRGQMATFLWRFGGEPVGPPQPFSDVPSGIYYEEAVGWLVQQGITSGTSPTTYSPNDPVTRAQMATFLWRYAGKPYSITPLSFTDVSESDWFSQPVKWLVGEGITNGTSPSTYDPDASVTRAQMATFLWRFADEPAVGQSGANRVPITFDCAGQSFMSTGECEALVIFLATLDADRVASTIAWPNPCQWFGVACTDGKLIQFDRQGTNQSGPLPPILGNWVNLRILDLNTNNLIGPVPPELAQLDQLVALHLQGNSLSGPIPSEIGGMPALTNLYLAANDLSGPIPSELGNLTGLTWLGLDGNRLTGSIPATIGNLTELTWLTLAANDLEGELPPELGNLTKVTLLNFENNRLSGQLPAELGGMTALQGLFGRSNELSGPVPPELQNLSNLNNLLLSGQAGCLTAATQGLSDWLDSYDAAWADGCGP